MAKSMGLNMASGLSGMLKDGHESFQGVDEAILRNITAAKQLADILKTSLGPNGMNKLVVNHLEKIIVTSDGATIVKELEVMHPAAKMVVLASQMQEKEFGDGTSFVVTFAGELLRMSAELLHQGLHTAEILEGFKRAYAETTRILPELVCHTVKDPRDEKELSFAIRSVLASKQYGFENTLAPFVARACLTVMPPAPAKASVNVDSVRVCKLLGGSVSDSHVIRGMVVQRNTEGTIKRVEKSKVTVFGCGIEASSTEAKGTVLIRTADELMNYNKGEEKMMEDIIRSVAETGTTTIICGGTVSDMALHFVEKYKMCIIKITSKWELRRLCAALNATALVRLGAPTPEEMGFCELVEVQEIGLRKVTVFQQSSDDSDTRLATVILRASTDSLLNDLERAVDDGVNCVKALCKNPEFVPGAGATEMALSMRILELAEKQEGLDQYAMTKYSEALQVIPRILSETCGQDTTKVMARMIAAHSGSSSASKAEGGEGTKGITSCMGIDITDDVGEGIVDQVKEGVVDLLATKESALRLAVDAAMTVLRVDQIIMSKAAGGPKPPGGR